MDKILVFSTLNPWGFRFAALLARWKVPYQFVTTSGKNPRNHESSNRYLWMLECIKFHLKGIEFFRRKLGVIPADLRSAIIHINDIQSEKLPETLAALGPDYIFNFSPHLLEESVYLKARKGTLNGHPGLLPWIRGVDCVAGALLRDTAVGSSCHLIDSGIDTGPVHSQTLVEPGSNDTLESLRTKANWCSYQLMVEALRHIRSGEPFVCKPQSQRFALNRRCTPAELAEAERRIACGHARALFEAWKEQFPLLRCLPGSPYLPTASIWNERVQSPRFEPRATRHQADVRFT